MAFASASDLRAAVARNDPHRFVSRYIFEAVPFVFGDDLELWIAWKSELAERLEVDPHEIVLTGSGAVGFSLAPNKRFSAFHATSDIDVAVISAHHFELAWRFLRQNRPAWLSLDARVKHAITSHRKNYVFQGTIATDFILPILPFAAPWQSALEHMAQQHPIGGREVKLRIYRDFEAFRAYTANTLHQLRTDILNVNDDEQPIETLEE